MSVCVYPACTRCLQCEANAESVARAEGTITGLAAGVRAIERVAVDAGDLLVARMCRDLLERGFSAPERRAA